MGFVFVFVTRPGALADSATDISKLLFSVSLILAIIGTVSFFVTLLPKKQKVSTRTLAMAALFAALCRQFALDPLADGVIISHREGYQRGIASNHGDPEHLWSKFGLQMDGFRADVVAALRGGYRVLAGTYPDLAAAKAQARTLLTAGFSATVLEPSGNEITLTRTGTVRVNTSLNIRSGPGTGYSRAGSLKNGDTVTLIDERDGWGALLQGGWVSLGYIINA